MHGFPFKIAHTMDLYTLFRRLSSGRIAGRSVPTRGMGLPAAFDRGFQDRGGLPGRRHRVTESFLEPGFDLRRGSTSVEGVEQRTLDGPSRGQRRPVIVSVSSETLGSQDLRLERRVVETRDDLRLTRDLRLPPCREPVIRLDLDRDA